ncbi:hypothetical protein BDP81DRAFT_434992 [Colletotrichum phormii]|uniref:Uncharacterized protein n=1 Tax=Colletotrichum phormii TaxID=359342 RepID=A0AAJ0EDG7_9PEZI|nr:uncharacterized protein BDP81DRAFT_434992 [Colletotrichum phormii]KAK1625577.1 hypothetical protein BDP81DRAFT_434992 [Colletotrichum phormii]
MPFSSCHHISRKSASVHVLKTRWASDQTISHLQITKFSSDEENRSEWMVRSFATFFFHPMPCIIQTLGPCFLKLKQSECGGYPRLRCKFAIERLPSPSFVQPWKHHNSTRSLPWHWLRSTLALLLGPGRRLCFLEYAAILAARILTSPFKATGSLSRVFSRLHRLSRASMICGSIE